MNFLKKKVAIKVYKIALIAVTAFGAAFGLADWNSVLSMIQKLFGL